ncbi:MAG: aminotransferase class IV family protein [Bacteroidetes bacterium]|nr:aminotransferase class IV family protein [Bacteroidota bacterium]
MNIINYNGKFFPEGSAVFPLNRAVNYGDGLFEGLRIHNGEILFFEDHMSRLFRAMKALKMEVPDSLTSAFLHRQITELARANETGSNARIRIGVFRSGGGLYEPQTHASEYFIEIIPMEQGYEWNEATCKVSVFPDVQKNFSTVSFFKSMNALPYVMAAMFKSENNLGDCFLLNASGKIADAISSNVFWIENGRIFSPPVSDGGVDGVTRKNLIHILAENNFPFSERSITPYEMASADEVFLTNVGWGIKPVSQFGDRTYSTRVTRQIFQWLVNSLG